MDIRVTPEEGKMIRIAAKWNMQTVTGYIVGAILRDIRADPEAKLAERLLELGVDTIGRHRPVFHREVEYIEDSKTKSGKRRIRIGRKWTEPLKIRT